jgi:hypothetical protein
VSVCVRERDRKVEKFVPAQANVKDREERLLTYQTSAVHLSVRETLATELYGYL